MNPPKMPIHIGDYMRDTGHLRAAEHGAYVMLLFHYWSTGSLPSDDRQLAAIARMSAAEWKRARPIIEAFFDPGWRHGRVEKDLATARASYEAKAKAGAKGGKAKADAKQNPSTATASAKAELQLPNTLDHLPDSEPKGSAAEIVGEDPKAKLFREGKTILASFGVSEKRCGSVLGQWLKIKNDPPGILGALRYARTNSVAEPVAYVSAIIHGRAKSGSNPTMDAFDALASGGGSETLATRAEPIDITERSSRIS